MEFPIQPPRLASNTARSALKPESAPGHPKRFEFVEKEPKPAFDEEPGLKKYLQDAFLSGDATEKGIELLERPSFKKDGTALYRYRELQNLRDPLHFRQR